jgi:hypothetical protein
MDGTQAFKQQFYGKDICHWWVASHKADNDCLHGRPDISVPVQQNSCSLPLRKNWLVLYETAAIETAVAAQRDEQKDKGHRHA